ncbi:hypothetical protein PSQ20_09055 [Curvibacter sp. RS43]|uniref:Zinc ribbon domain-containing protein n=1 Tax=Curvibacter microcysteis TaxID=3026419 RepID=A0ABT5MH85_9BURK|nr:MULTISPECIES: hypothetical protein [unclassified Curvibacter]MDD0810481.1 hypothetical protein [Curvibacter sp. RS43]MDD0815781.1 hypothetical protein [Curvibacter sp. HBC28]
MGSVICRECGTRFEGKAFVCPHCKAWRGVAGTGAQPSEEADSSWLQAVALVLMALTLLATLGVALFWPESPPPLLRNGTHAPTSEVAPFAPQPIVPPLESPNPRG